MQKHSGLNERHGVCGTQTLGSALSESVALKSNIDATDPGDAQSTTGVLGNTADSQAGIVYLNFTNAQTSVLEAQTYNYDIQQIDGTGAVQTLFIGRVKVDKDVTLTIA